MICLRRVFLKLVRLVGGPQHYAEQIAVEFVAVEAGADVLVVHSLRCLREELRHLNSSVGGRFIMDLRWSLFEPLKSQILGRSDLCPAESAHRPCAIWLPVINSRDRIISKIAPVAFIWQWLADIVADDFNRQDLYGLLVSGSKSPEFNTPNGRALIPSTKKFLAGLSFVFVKHCFLLKSILNARSCKRNSPFVPKWFASGVALGRLWVFVGGSQRSGLFGIGLVGQFQKKVCEQTGLVGIHGHKYGHLSVFARNFHPDHKIAVSNAAINVHYLRLAGASQGRNRPFVLAFAGGKP